MARQLHLLPQSDHEAPRDWRLDDATRTLGFQGVAQARAALRASRTTPSPPVRPTPATPGTSTDVRRPAA